MACIEKELEDINGVIRIRKPKDRQHNGQKKKDKQRFTKHHTEEKSGACRVTLETNPVISHE